MIKLKNIIKSRNVRDSLLGFASAASDDIVFLNTRASLDQTNTS